MGEAELRPRIQVRETELEDLERIAEIREAAWLATYVNEELGVTPDLIKQKLVGMSVSNDIEVRRQNLENALQDPTKINLICTDIQGRVVGFLFGEKFEDYNKLRSIYVDPAAHGQGYGSALIGDFLAWADPEKPTKLTAVSYNQKAINFYKKFGFEPTDIYVSNFDGHLPQVELLKPPTKIV